MRRSHWHRRHWRVTGRLRTTSLQALHHHAGSRPLRRHRSVCFLFLVPFRPPLKIRGVMGEIICAGFSVQRKTQLLVDFRQGTAVRGTEVRRSWKIKNSNLGPSQTIQSGPNCTECLGRFNYHRRKSRLFWISDLLLSFENIALPSRKALPNFELFDPPVKLRGWRGEKSRQNEDKLPALRWIL